MTTLHEIKQKKQAAVDTLLDTCGVFFAFSNEQFAENKTPLKEGEKYVSIGAGGYMPQGNVKTFIQGMDDIKKDFAKSMKQSKQLRYDNIKHELNNHEAYYTNDITDTLAALGEGYTAKEVWKVFKAESEKEYQN